MPHQLGGLRRSYNKLLVYQLRGLRRSYNKLLVYQLRGSRRSHKLVVYQFRRLHCSRKPALFRSLTQPASGDLELS